jgi:polar amino acid transport system substrate-binding protein
VAACGVPRDPEHTFDRVRQYRQVRVGLSENPPWVIRSAGEPGGAEVILVRQFAAAIGAAPVWVWGAEQQHMQSLKRFELDIAIAGFDSSTPWKKTVGFTRPWFEERIVIGVPPSMQAPESLEGTRVAVRTGDAAAAVLLGRHADAVRVPELSRALGPIAAPDWRIEQFGFRATKFRLMTLQHVMAVPPGENGWLKRLEEFLFQRQSEIRGLLQQQMGKA